MNIKDLWIYFLKTWIQKFKTDPFSLQLNKKDAGKYFPIFLYFHQKSHLDGKKSLNYVTIVIIAWNSFISSHF